MLIKVFDTDYFDPAGVRVDEINSGYDGDDQEKWNKPIARIIFGKREVYNEGYESRNTPEPKYYTALDCIFVQGKTADEVATAINAEIRKLNAI